LKNCQISNFTKICPVEAELFHVDRWTDITQLLVTFHNFANVPKNKPPPCLHLLPAITMLSMVVYITEEHYEKPVRTVGTAAKIHI